MAILIESRFWGAVVVLLIDIILLRSIAYCDLETDTSYRPIDYW